MDTKLKKSKLIKAFCYRIIAVGALFTMIFTGIMGREALKNFKRTGSGILSGEIFYLTDFRAYVSSLYLQAMTGYAGAGDDYGFRLTGSNAIAVSKQALEEFHDSLEAAGEELLYHIDINKTTLESGNISYPLFSESDGHLLLPKDVKLCYYWDGPNNTLTYFGSKRNSPISIPDYYCTQQYKPNIENASKLRVLIAIKESDIYSNSTLVGFVNTAESYQLVLTVFFSSLTLFVIFFSLSLLSHKLAKQMWESYAHLSSKLWLECKLLCVVAAFYLCYYFNLWFFHSSLDNRMYFYDKLWLYFLPFVLTYLLYKDWYHNRHTLWKKSITYSILCFIKEYRDGLSWHRKVMNICVITLVSSLLMIIAGILLLYFTLSDYYLISPYIPNGINISEPVFMYLFFSFGCALGVIGILLLLYSIRLRNFVRDSKTLHARLSRLREGTCEAPLSLPTYSLLHQAAADLNALEDGIEAAVEQQNRSNKMRVELITNVSHDLKTPLTSIINYADLLCEENLPKPASEYASALQAKAYRLKNMVQDVFELSKATSDNLPIEKTLLDLAKLIKQTLADMDERILESSLTFKLSIATEPIMIEADGDKLYRVFQNLIVNALQYSLEHSRVHIQLTTENGYAYAKVKNTSLNELDFEPAEILERFVRADVSRTTEGSGLGLSIAQSFTEKCGGSFSISIDADMFTACVCFPLADVPSNTALNLPEDFCQEIL